MPPNNNNNTHTTAELPTCPTCTPVHHQLRGQKPPIKRAQTHRTYNQYTISTITRVSFITLPQSIYKERESSLSSTLKKVKVQVYAGIRRCVQMYASLCLCIQVHGGVCNAWRCMQVHAGVCRCMQVYAVYYICISSVCPRKVTSKRCSTLSYLLFSNYNCFHAINNNNSPDEAIHAIKSKLLYLLPVSRRSFSLLQSMICAPLH